MANCIFLYRNDHFKVEDSDDDESDEGNQFGTAEAHPFLETAFNLGMMGLGKLGEKPDDPSHDRAQPHRAYYTHVSPVKKHLSEFCRFVDFYPDIFLLFSCVSLHERWIEQSIG